MTPEDYTEYFAQSKREDTSDATQEERCIVWILSPWIEGDVSNVDIDGNNAL
jgi:hypothetical protein